MSATTARWRAAGLSERQLYSLTESGQLVKIRRGVYATSGVMARAETDPGLRHALDVVAVRDTRTGKGVASHHSAAQLLRLNLLNAPPPGTVTLTVPPGTRVSDYARTGVICHAGGGAGRARDQAVRDTRDYGGADRRRYRTHGHLHGRRSWWRTRRCMSGIRRRRSYAGCFCDVIGGPGFRERGGWLSSRTGWPNRRSSRVRGSFSVSRGCRLRSFRCTSLAAIAP